MIDNPLDPAAENPYAAPQAELCSLPSSTDARTNYLRQGVTAGLQLGGLAAFLIVTFAIGTWSENWTITKLILIPAITLFCFTAVGLLVGLAVQLFTTLFGVAPTDSVLPALPSPTLEPPESAASQELDKTGHLPPPLI